MNPQYKKYRERMLKQQNALRCERKSKNLCTYCGKKPPEKSKILCLDCLEKVKKRFKNFRQRRVDNKMCIRCGSVELSSLNSRLCELCRQKSVVIAQRSRNKVKDIVFNGYGGYRCTCCSETHHNMLQLDHVQNDGNHQRSSISCKNSGMVLYRWIIANNFPKIFQILCANCNWSKRMNNGICEHQTEKQLLEQANKIVSKVNV